MEPENLKLDKYILAQVINDSLKICFVPTASGDQISLKKTYYIKL